MEFIIWGYGSALDAECIGTSFTVNKNILFEAPPAINSTLSKNSIDISCINNIFISHLHGDHYFGQCH